MWSTLVMKQPHPTLYHLLRIDLCPNFLDDASAHCARFAGGIQALAFANQVWPARSVGNGQRRCRRDKFASDGGMRGHISGKAGPNGVLFSGLALFCKAGRMLE
jgi:hypothetical protein